MKKAISEAKVQRMRNLVTGKYKAKTATQDFQDGEKEKIL